MFNDFLTNLNAGTSAVTVVNGAFYSALSFASLFSSTLFRQFSMRSVGVFGGFVYFTGSFLTIFATSVEHLIVSFGVLQGAGIGFCAPVGEFLASKRFQSQIETLKDKQELFPFLYPKQVTQCSIITS